MPETNRDTRIPWDKRYEPSEMFDIYVEVGEIKLSDIKTKYRSREYLIEAEKTDDAEIIKQTFQKMKCIGKNQLVFSEADYSVFDILRYVTDNHIALLKLERIEPTLESLFMEVIDK